MSTIWFTDFHASGSNTRIPSKQNMMLETIENFLSDKS